ncbi:hypothetical protein QF001_003742 [Paraburkholderia youngii]
MKRQRRDDREVLDKATREARGILVRQTTIERVLLHNCELPPTPHVQLVVAVLARAIADCALPRRGPDAQAFMRGERLEQWCYLVGLEPAFVREVAVKTGYLPDPEHMYVCTRPLQRDVSEAQPSY